MPRALRVETPPGSGRFRAARVNGRAATTGCVNCCGPSAGVGACCLGVAAIPDGLPPEFQIPPVGDGERCILLTAAQCSAAGGRFLGVGIPCSPGRCDPPPLPGCCTAPTGCYMPERTSDSDTYTVTIAFQYSGLYVYGVAGVPPRPFTGAHSITTNESMPLAPDCNYQDGLGMFGFGGAQEDGSPLFEFINPGGTAPVFHVWHLGQFVNPPDFVLPASCVGGVQAIGLPDVEPNGPFIDAIRNRRLSFMVSITKAQRCDGGAIIGRCCFGPTATFPNGGCLDNIPIANCQAVGGLWGLGTCAANPCPPGACCAPDGQCFNLDEPGCAGLVGGPGIWFPTFRCSDSLAPCVVRGACCYPSGQCVEPMTAAECFASGGFTFSPGEIGGLPYTPRCPGLDCTPPIPCCNDASCSDCMVRGTFASSSIIDLQVSSDLFWPTPACGFVGTISDTSHSETTITEDLCDYATQSVGVTLFGPPGLNPAPQPLQVFAQFKSCDAARGLGPHVVVSVQGSAQRFTAGVTCSGVTGMTIPWVDSGLPCGASRSWRNIQIGVSATVGGGIPCFGTAARLARPITRKRILMPGIDFGAKRAPCAGCGKGLGKVVF